MTSNILLVEGGSVTWLLLSPTAQAFDMRNRSDNLIPSPSSVFEWPPDCLGCERRTRRSLYKMWKNLQTPQLNLKQKISLKHLDSPSTQDLVSQLFSCAWSESMGIGCLAFPEKSDPEWKVYTQMEKPTLRPQGGVGGSDCLIFLALSKLFSYFWILA